MKVTEILKSIKDLNLPNYNGGSEDNMELNYICNNIHITLDQYDPKHIHISIFKYDPLNPSHEVIHMNINISKLTNQIEYIKQVILLHINMLENNTIQISE